jgi:hypothetical protein
MIVVWRALAIGHPRTAHGAVEAEETMSRIRSVLRSAIVLGAVVAGVSALDLVLATPAAARCFGYGCGYRYHARPTYPAYVRRAAMPRWSIAPWQRRHAAPVQRNPTAASISPHGCKHCYQRNPNAAAVSPHGPTGITNPSGASFSPYGPGGGGGSGQYTTTGFPGSSEQLSGPGSTRSAPGGSAPAKPTSGPVLTAVAACVTPKGSCPMQRDLGTACQCKDQQGNLYDGIMK